jgi:hypothetical protein
MNGNNTQVYNLPPIVTRRVNVVHTYQVINQPHICEEVTQVCNHVIKRHQYYQKPLCCQSNDYQEENNGCCQNNANAYYNIENEENNNNFGCR